MYKCVMNDAEVHSQIFLSMYWLEGNFYVDPREMDLEQIMSLPLNVLWVYKQYKVVDTIVGLMITHDELL